MRLTNSFDVGEFKSRITSMQAQIEQAMSEQDELF
jgi:hypothetical protein